MTEDDTTEEQWALSLYHAATVPLLRRPADWYTWVRTWEEAMGYATEHELNSTSNALIWVPEFVRVVRPFFPSFEETFMGEYRAQVHTNSLRSFRVLADRFRDHLRSKGVLHAKGGKVTHGVFNMQEATDKYEDNATVATEKEALTSSNKSKRGKRKRGKEAEMSGKALVCEACNRRGHLFEAYWYVFPEQSAVDWKPRKEIKKTVLGRIEKEPLKSRLDAIRQIKRSRTGTAAHDDKAHE